MSAAVTTERDIVLKTVVQPLSKKSLQAPIQEFYMCSVSYSYSEIRQEVKCT